MDGSLIEEIRQHVYQHGLDATVERYAAALSQWDGEPAGIWVRVSSGGQDEVNQVPEVIEHCARRGYRPVKWYILHDKSAKKGEQQSKLDEMVHDMRHQEITVGVCWKASRMERRGPRHTFRLLADVSDAGCRVESVSQPQWGTGGVAGQTLTSLYASIDEEFSDTLSDNVKLSFDRIKANGAVGPGGKPWGYEITGPKYGKALVATAICREYVPQIFSRCIAGESCRTIAMWLDSENVPPTRGAKWHQGSVLKLIHNMAYAGRWQNKAKTQTVSKCEAVVSLDVWQRANAALANRPKRGPIQEDNRPMLAGLKCARCADSPMYRIRLKSRSGKGYFYYRCTGRGAQRKGCGNMVPFELAEFIVASQIFVHSTEPHTIDKWIEGKSWENEISEVKQDIREAADAERFEDMPALQAKLADLRSRKSIPGHNDEVKTGKTVGEHFWNLDNDGKRAYLATRDIRVEKVPVEVNPSGIRVVIDGQEHEVTVREWNAAMRQISERNE